VQSYLKPPQQRSTPLVSDLRMTSKALFSQGAAG
jgi:hypothetical protein